MASTYSRCSAAIAGVLGVVAGVSFAAAGPTCPPTLAPPTQDEVQAAMRGARDHGALWTIEKDGHGSWLFGTIHVGNLAMSIPGPKVMQALAAADVLAIEVDVTNPAILAAVRAPRESSDGPAVMIVASLTALEARWDGLDPSYGSEFVLAGFAQARKMPIVSLESAGIQRRALSGGPPGQQLAAVDRGIAALEQGHVRPAARALARVWQAGDLATIADHERWSSSPSSPEAKADAERMVVSRNPDLAASIDLAHRDGKRVFAAAGVLHMVGDGGLPKLLQKLGYKVERVSFGGDSDRPGPDPAPR